MSTTVDVTKRFRAKETTSNVYNYTSNTQAGVIYTPIPPMVLAFDASATPGIVDYSIYAAIYGQYPHLTILAYDADGNLLELADKPKWTMDDDGIVSIAWDLGRDETGLIILYSTL